MDKQSVAYPSNGVLLGNKKKNELSIHATSPWMNCKCILLSERRLTWKVIYYMLSFLWLSGKQKIAGIDNISMIAEGRLAGRGWQQWDSTKEFGEWRNYFVPWLLVVHTRHCTFAKTHRTVHYKEHTFLCVNLKINFKPWKQKATKKLLTWRFWLCSTKMAASNGSRQTTLLQTPLPSSPVPLRSQGWRWKSFHRAKK